MEIKIRTELKIIMEMKFREVDSFSNIHSFKTTGLILNVKQSLNAPKFRKFDSVVLF